MLSQPMGLPGRHADAIRILTEAVRLTNTPTRQTSTGTWEPDPTGTPQPIDWAEFVTLALAGAAANLGSIYRILAGRPGSREAVKVREVLESTVGVDDQHLWEHRTEPVQVHLHVGNILRDTGDESLDQYAAADNELIDRRRPYTRRRWSTTPTPPRQTAFSRISTNCWNDS